MVPQKISYPKDKKIKLALLISIVHGAPCKIVLLTLEALSMH